MKKKEKTKKAGHMFDRWGRLGVWYYFIVGFDIILYIHICICENFKKIIHRRICQRKNWNELVLARFYCVVSFFVFVSSPAMW